MMENKSLERQWLIDRLETLSVKEQTQLAAAIISRGQLKALSEKAGEERELAVRKMDPNTAKEAVNLLLALPDYEVICPAGSYEQLGEYYLRYEASQPDLIPYANLEQIGWNYEDSHLGIFVGDCFVVLPRQEPRQFYDGTNLDQLLDADWSLRLKLASPAVPEGVWLCLPDSTIDEEGRMDEIRLALRELKVQTLGCAVLPSGAVCGSGRVSGSDGSDLRRQRLGVCAPGAGPRGAALSGEVPVGAGV